MRESSIRRPQPSRTPSGGRPTTSEAAVGTVRHVIAYQPTAYVGNQILVSAVGRGVRPDPRVTKELNDELRKSRNFPNGWIELRLPEPTDLELTDRLVASQSPRSSA